MIKYAIVCQVVASNKDEKIAKNSLQSNIHNLAIYSREHHLTLIASKTEFVCFSKQYDQRNKTQDTILVDNKLSKKSNECKCFGLTIKSSINFMNHVKQSLKRTAQGLKTID